MRKLKRCAAILLTMLLAFQFLSIPALAADGTGFTDVVVNADVSSQTVTVSGRISTGTQKDITVILKQADTVLYLNQFTSDVDGAFEFQIPADFTYGDSLTLQLGGVSAVGAYVEEFTAGEEISLDNVSVSASYSKQELAVSGQVSPASAQTLTLSIFRSGVSLANVTFDSSENGAFAYREKLTLQVGDQLNVTISGSGSETLYSGTVTVTNDSVESGGGGSSPVTYVITATAGAGGSISPASKTVNQNGSATFTIQPKAGYQTKDVLVDGVSVGAVSSYTFEKVVKNHSIAAEFSPSAAWKNPFSDVKEGDWCYSAVQFVNQHGLFSGTAATVFSPNAGMTRGMLVLVLYRLAGTPAVGEKGFSDVPTNSVYANAVAWASSLGIVNGTSEGLFNPAGQITRAQIAAILYRYAQKTGKDVSASGNLNGFSDAGQIADYAVDAMKWAVGHNLMQGNQSGLLNPNGFATRAQVATILMRFVQQFAS